MNINKINFLKNELDKINIHFKKKNYLKVIKKSETLLKNNSNQHIIYNYIGLSYVELNNLDSARKIFFKAIENDNLHASIFCNLGIVHKNLFLFSAAEKNFQKALELNKDHIQSLINLGHLKSSLNHTKEAEIFYQRAYLINKSEEILTYVILNHFANSKFSDAKRIIEEFKYKFPNNTKVDHFFSRVHNYKNDTGHLNEMLEKTNNKNLSPEDNSNLYFAIAKAYSDQNQIKESAEFIIKANETKFQTFEKYDFLNEENLFKQMKAYFKNFNFNKSYQSDNDDKLIFVVGLPRSGTTLLHQIIGAHSNVFAADESIILEGIFNTKFKNTTAIKQFFNLEPIDSKNKSDLYNLIKQNYKMHHPNKIVLDKMPFNFKWIGFIKMFFPNAKIIHCNRNVQDTALSIYKNLFEGPTMAWTNSPYYLTKYIHLYQDLMNFWKSKLGDFIYESNYETLVNNQIEETKNILNYCNLNFEDSCVNFYENSSPTKTISVAQARNRIHKDSVSLGKKYLEYLPFLKQI